MYVLANSERASLGRLLCTAGKSGQSWLGHTLYSYCRFHGSQLHTVCGTDVVYLHSWQR